MCSINTCELANGRVRSTIQMRNHGQSAHIKAGRSEREQKRLENGEWGKGEGSGKKGRQTRDGEAERGGEIQADLKEEAHLDLHTICPTISPLDHSALQDKVFFGEPDTVWFGNGVEPFACMIA